MVILVLGKARSHRAPNLGYRGAESPGWFDVSLKNSARDIMHEWVHCHDEAANHQLPITTAFWKLFAFIHIEILKLKAKFDADSLLYSFSHFECDDHTVHMLTQRCLPPPLTSTVKSSLFMHIHYNPLSLAARLHQCLTYHSRYINNGWTFSRQTSYIKNHWILHYTSVNGMVCKLHLNKTVTLKSRYVNLAVFYWENP